MDAPWALGRLRAPLPLTAKPALLHPVPRLDSPPTTGRPEPGQAFIKAGPLQGAAGGSGSSAVRAPCGFLNAGCQQQVYFGLCILHRAGQQPGSTAGGGQRLHPAPPAQRLQGVCSITGHGGRIPRLGSDHDSAKISPPPLRGQLRRPRPGTATRARAPGMRQIQETRLNQRGNKQKEDRGRGPRQTERGCHPEPGAGVVEAARGDTAHGRAGVDTPAEVSAKALRQAMRPESQRQGAGQTPPGRRLEESLAQGRYQAIRASLHQQTQALRWAPRPQLGGRVRPSEEHPSHARPQWGQSLQHQDSRVGLHPNPKAASAVSPSHPRPSHLGHLPSSCPRRPWGPPAHICRAPWPSQRPGSPCPESPSFRSQSSHDPQRPGPRREQRQRTGGAAQARRRDTGRKRLHQADTSACRRSCCFLPAAQNSQHILQAASPILPVTNSTPHPPRRTPSFPEARHS